MSSMRTAIRLCICTTTSKAKPGFFSFFLSFFCFSLSVHLHSTTRITKRSSRSGTYKKESCLGITAKDLLFLQGGATNTTVIPAGRNRANGSHQKRRGLYLAVNVEGLPKKHG